MVDDFVFTIVIAIYNVENYLKETIDSVINQSFNFDDVQLILVDDGSIDNSKEIALEYQSKYPNNILVLSKENGGPASAYNLALKHIKGQYVNFLESDDKLSENTLNEVNKFFSKNKEIDLVSIPMFYFELTTREHPLNDKFKNRNTVVDLIKNPTDFQMSLAPSFVRKTALEGYTFDERLINAYDTLLLNKILLKNKKYGLIGLKNKAVYYYRRRYLKNSLSYTVPTKKEFFTDKLKYFSKSLLDYSLSKESSVPDFIKSIILYDLRFLVNQPELHEDLTIEEIKEFWDCFDDILELLDTDDILNQPFLYGNNKNFLIYLKNKSYYIDCDDNSVVLGSEDVIFKDLTKSNLWFDTVDIKDGTLNILGAIVNNFFKESISIEAIKESNDSIEIFKPEFFEFPYSKRKTVSFLGHDWKFYHTFNFNIPFKEGDITKIHFKIIFNENDNKSSIEPNVFRFNAHAGLSGYSHYSIKGSNIILYTNKSFIVMPYNYSKILRFELNAVKKILSTFKLSLFPALLYRFIFIILFPSMINRDIWLFNDRPDRADDNGKHLFSYVVKQDDNIEKYYVLNKDCNDFNVMKSIDNNILAFGSFKHKILYLFANKVITPFLNEDYFNPFFRNRRFYNGFIHSKKYFLQHGITIGNISRPINRFRKNLALFVTSADLERKSILEGGYNFDEDIVQTLGFPRYDNLKNMDSVKQILFMPTWRNYLKKEEALLKSDYFKKLNSFLNNEKLIKIAKEKGYKIAFRAHPEVIKYVDSFEIKNDVVWISKDESYQELFNNSSILVTDYSSVFFDFSYLKKPVIYYQYEDDYHYDKGYFDFETLGFGDVISSEDILIDKIIEYLENDCEMEDKYKQRVDKFFKFTDQNNCKRVYEFILND